MLDSLMGRNRNECGRNKRGDSSFKDDEICKFFLLDYCPHELFPNTRSDLGPCPKEHRPDLKEAFEKDENHEYYKALYEQEFMKFLKRLVDQMESRIKKVQQRIDANNTVTELDKDTAEKVNAVNAQISELLKKQDEAGAKGEIDVAEKLNEEVALLQREVQRLKNPHADIATIRESQLRVSVCAVCGALQSAGDALCRYESHASGKQHRGFEKIRSSLAKLVETEREREAVLGRGVNGARRREASHPRASERGRGDSGLRGRSPQNRDRGGSRDAGRRAEHAYRSRGGRFEEEEEERRRRERTAGGDRGSRYREDSYGRFSSAYRRDGRGYESRRGGDETLSSRARYGERDREGEREGRFRSRDYPEGGRQRGYDSHRSRDGRYSRDCRDRGEEDFRRDSERMRERHRRYRDDRDERDEDRGDRGDRGGEREEIGDREDREERERQRSRYSRRSRSGDRAEEEGEAKGGRETKRRRYEEERGDEQRRDGDYAYHGDDKPTKDPCRGDEGAKAKSHLVEAPREGDSRAHGGGGCEKDEKNGYRNTEAANAE
ncbi:putative alternative splicing type 3 and [Toxoplasma gondii MAS]|uniref:Putative alternative splicing type 3 and n=1 Tax=Toxoplasma gondii MAS TaxID=943118 RepID=A0A086Q6N8_TOXGO|nr:putative alternative splicing type 3 and [Toxoplasma gondii MAS]